MKRKLVGIAVTSLALSAVLGLAPAAYADGATADISTSVSGFLNVPLTLAQGSPTVTLTGFNWSDPGVVFIPPVLDGCPPSAVDPLPAGLTLENNGLAQPVGSPPTVVITGTPTALTPDGGANVCLIFEDGPNGDTAFAALNIIVTNAPTPPADPPHKPGLALTGVDGAQLGLAAGAGTSLALIGGALMIFGRRPRTRARS